MGYQVYCDGAYRRSIGSVIGVFIQSEDGNEEFKLSSQLKGKSDVFAAEALAVLAALKHLLKIDVINESIEVFTDNQELVRAINSLNNFSKEDVFAEIYDMKKKFCSITFTWIPRKENVVAHKLCRELFDQKSMERRAKKLKVKYDKDDKYLVESTNVEGLFYKVCLTTLTCSCRHYSLQKKCKHVVAAQLYSERYK